MKDYRYTNIQLFFSSQKFHSNKYKALPTTLTPTPKRYTMATINNLSCNCITFIKMTHWHYQRKVLLLFFFTRIWRRSLTNRRMEWSTFVSGLWFDQKRYLGTNWKHLSAFSLSCHNASYGRQTTFPAYQKISEPPNGFHSSTYSVSPQYQKITRLFNDVTTANIG